MKKIILGLVATTLLLSSCTKILKLANINVDIPYNQQVTVPAVAGYTQSIALPPGGAALALPSIPFATNSQIYISQNNTAANMILDVSLKSLTLQILSPSDQNFDFLDNIQVFLSSKTLPEVLVAYQTSVPKGQTTLDLSTNPLVNLKDYFIQDTIYFRLTTHINATPLSGTQLNIASVFHMLANPLQ